NNTGSGVLVQGAQGSTPAASGIGILTNSIFGNGGPGIDIQPGANNGITPPVLDNPVVSGGMTMLRGILFGVPNQTYVIDFFSSPVPPGAGAPEGKTVPGETTTTTGSNGQSPLIQFQVNSDLTGQFVTATATDPANNTSGYAREVPFSGPTPTPTTTTLTF